ncbi:hypothetical protein [Dactylosporangium sp. CA-233914]|uniref:hypothetical protein n=1 Tax=Dactylosporangium sp. CA-233914 TaxID=3239934 RepID=UPI003D8C897F
MRDNKLGRWMVRLAVTAGVGVVALGISSTAAQASDYARGVTVSQARSLTYIGDAQSVQADPIYVTEDFSWG